VSVLASNLCCINDHHEVASSNAVSKLSNVKHRPYKLGGQGTRSDMEMRVSRASSATATATGQKKIDSNRPLSSQSWSAGQIAPQNYYKSLSAETQSLNNYRQVNSASRTSEDSRGRSSRTPQPEPHNNHHDGTSRAG
jgi:hypothetical protein